MTELKPCPFCGDYPKITFGPRDTWIEIYCCRPNFTSEKQAYDFWNRRADQPQRAMSDDRKRALEAYNIIERELSVGLDDMGQTAFWNEEVHGAMACLYRSIQSQPPEGYVLVPIEPTEEQWTGLARDIVMWHRMGDRPTGKALYDHLKALGREIPDWLIKEIRNDESVPAKGDVASIIYKAMIAAYQKETE